MRWIGVLVTALDLGACACLQRLADRRAVARRKPATIVQQLVCHDRRS